MIKPIAFYLPQFHEIEENNRWWGKGFTEWTSVKNATPVFKGHQQPRRPLEDNYYNLLEKKTMQWQAELARKYHVYGFCMYHYYFKDGKKLLEKPAENLLEWKDIDINFCFSWANEPWIRTWSKIQGNDWNELQDYNVDNDTERERSGVLMEQDYGDEQAWKKHFEYLLPFFKDSRYIKVENKPMMVIYHVSKIDCINEMLACWNELAKQQGFSGIYILSTNEVIKGNPYVSGMIKYEPDYIQKIGINWKVRFTDYMSYVWKKIGGNYLRKVNYDDTWKAILRPHRYENVDIYPGAFVDYDDTPRRGKNGEIFTKVTPKKFADYFGKLVKQCKSFYKKDFVFINAWNEWAEGAYLEPDQVNGYKWLEGIKKAIEESGID